MKIYQITYVEHGTTQLATFFKFMAAKGFHSRLLGQQIQYGNVSDISGIQIIYHTI